MNPSTNHTPYPYLPMIRVLLLAAGAFLYISNLLTIFFGHTIYSAVLGLDTEAITIISNTEYKLFEIVCFQSCVMGISLILLAQGLFVYSWLQKRNKRSPKQEITKGEINSI